MPSNALKISQLVAKLQTIQADQGDLDCVLLLMRDAQALAIDGQNVGVAVRFPWGTLPAPVLVFGAVITTAGGLTNAAGNLYETTDTPGVDWNHDRDAAPTDETALTFWKRNPPRQIDGKRDASGAFFVHDGQQYVQIVDEAILGWKVKSGS